MAKRITVVSARKAIRETGGDPAAYEQSGKSLETTRQDWDERAACVEALEKALRWLTANGYDTSKAAVARIGIYARLDWSGYYYSTAYGLVRDNID